MSRKTVPEHVIVTCDRCGKSGVPGDDGAFKYSQGSIKLIRAGNGYAWSGGDSETSVIDLCSKCLGAFDSFMSPPQPASQQTSTAPEDK